jgi:hypothetical protein
MSGPRRLAVFASAVWVTVVFFASVLDPVFRWEFLLAIGVAPVALLWGVVWVVAGFRPR